MNRPQTRTRDAHIFLPNQSHLGAVPLLDRVGGAIRRTVIYNNQFGNRRRLRKYAIDRTKDVFASVVGGE